MRARSVLGAYASRFPVLLFLGMRKSGPGDKLLRIRSLSSEWISMPADFGRVSCEIVLCLYQDQVNLGKRGL